MSECTHCYPSIHPSIRSPTHIGMYTHMHISQALSLFPSDTAKVTVQEALPGKGVGVGAAALNSDPTRVPLARL